MLRTLKKNGYYLFFSVYKWFKYPTCKIYTNHIHPAAKIGKHVQIEKFCKIDRGVEIGDYTYINEYTRIDSDTRSIGKFCSISHNVKIGMRGHPLNRVTTSPMFYSKMRGYVDRDTYGGCSEKGFTEIGNDVFIAANAIVFVGVKVGTGAVISAGSIVTKDVPPFAVVAGVPARIVRLRFDQETVDRLLKSAWWEKDIELLLKHHQSMSDINKFLDILEAEEK